MDVPSNRLSDYRIEVTWVSDLSELRVRILITRCVVGQPPVTFEMLLTGEQWLAFKEHFVLI
jgi:hypothetical protein